jgi:hypothetical protein
MKRNPLRAIGRSVGLIVLALCFVISCAKTTENPLSSDKAITAFSFASPAATGTISESAKTIALNVPAGTAVTALVASFTTTGSSVSVGSTAQVSGTTANDFTKAVTYIVTAADSSTANYAVTVTVEAPMSSEKAIKSFTFLAADNPGKLGADAAGTIDDSVKNIHASFPAGTSTLALKPSIVVSPGATVFPASLAATDFSNTVTYTVTAADGSKQAYSVCAMDEPATPEMLWNGDFAYVFSYGSANHAAGWYDWQGTGAASTVDFSSKACVLSGSPRGPNPSSICLAEKGLNLGMYSIYRLQFDASSTNPTDVISVVFAEDGVDINADGNLYSAWCENDFSLSSTTKTYSTLLVTQGFENKNVQLVFWLGGSNASGTITIDNVSLKSNGTYAPPSGGEMVRNGDFSLEQNFWNYYSSKSTGISAQGNFSNKNFTLPASESARGTSIWNCGLISGGKNLKKAVVYRVSFDAYSTAVNDSMNFGLAENSVDRNGDGDSGSAWTLDTVILGTAPHTYSYDLTMSKDYDDPTAALRFCFGATTGTITIDNVSMKPVP